MLRRFQEKFIPEPNSGCNLWLAGMTKDGYGKFKMGGKTMPAHRVAWMFAYGEIPEGLQVLHKCDVRSCVNPKHLFLGTNKDNMADRNRKGRATGPHGERSFHAKLTADQVREIRMRYENRYGQATELAKEFGVTNSAIVAIASRRNWKHI